MKMIIQINNFNNRRPIKRIKLMRIRQITIEIILEIEMKEIFLKKRNINWKEMNSQI